MRPPCSRAHCSERTIGRCTVLSVASAVVGMDVCSGVQRSERPPPGLEPLHPLENLGRLPPPLSLSSRIGKAGIWPSHQSEEGSLSVRL